MKTTENIGLLSQAKQNTQTNQVREEKQTNQNKPIVEVYVDSTHLSGNDLKSVYGFIVHVNGNIVKYIERSS